MMREMARKRIDAAETGIAGKKQSTNLQNDRVWKKE